MTHDEKKKIVPNFILNEGEKKCLVTFEPLDQFLKFKKLNNLKFY